MQRCIELARNARGSASPNPLVGCVIVHEHKIIGEGWHHRAGEAHAEVNAIRSVKDQSLLKNATLYVNLEPCAHYGKTPPCADLIIASQILRVVIANQDPHTAVAGKGIKRMENAGIEVIKNVLNPEARILNQSFFCYHELKRPYVILKWAESRDGFLDKIRNGKQVGPNWITQSETQSLVHKWRAESDAIMIGGNTLRNDNPSLNVRAFFGKNPRPVVVVSRNNFGHDAKLTGDQNTLILSKKPGLTDLKAEVITFEESNFKAANWLAALASRNLQSVLVEGGATLLSSFLKSGLWDEARVLIGEKKFGIGLKAPSIELPPANIHRFGKDKLKIYYS